MTILDTNHILRWFLQDVPTQAAASTQLLEQSSPQSLYIDRVSLAETTYVLRGKGYNHHQISQIIEALYAYPSVRNATTLTQTTLQLFRDTNLDFEDCVLAAWHKTAGYNVATFDKALQKQLDQQR